MQMGADVGKHHARQNRRSLEPIRRHLKLLTPIFKLIGLRGHSPDFAVLPGPQSCQFTILSGGLFGQSGRFYGISILMTMEITVTCRRLNRLSRADAAHFFRARACHHAGALSPAPISERRANRPLGGCSVWGVGGRCIPALPAIHANAAGRRRLAASRPQQRSAGGGRDPRVRRCLSGQSHASGEIGAE